jgi:hypothetical protein
MVLTSPLLELATWLEIAAGLVLLAGCVLFHLRLRTSSSLSFLLSVVATALWAYLARTVLYHSVTSQATPSTAAALTTMDRADSIVAIGDAMLALWLSVSFLLAVRAIRRADRHAA